MPFYVVDQLAGVLDRRKGISLSVSRILVVGVAYKKNVDDTRESPALVIIEILKSRGATVDYYDPYVSAIPKTRSHPSLAGMRSIPFDLELMASYHAVLIVTDHSEIDWTSLAKAAQIIVDTRNATASISVGKDKIVLV